MVIKAVAGGGGRGMRVVHASHELTDAYERCRSEAAGAFGDDRLYVEQLLPQARHVEVQIVADGRGGLVHLGERECTLQRRHQKLVELAPSPSVTPALRDQLCAAAVRLAAAANFDGVGTFEFLVDAAAPPDRAPFFFIEANPRLQVEHTVTEAVTGLDLVALQLGIAAGRSLADLGLAAAPAPRGLALQARVNMETIAADGTVKPSGGTLTAFDAPSGPGIRVDTCAYAGWTPSPRFDSLLAKVVVHVPGDDVAAVVDKAYRALSALRIDGIATNVGLLQTLLSDPDVRAMRVTTDWIDAHAGALAAADADRHPRRFFAAATPTRTADTRAEPAAPPGTLAVRAPLQGTVVSIDAAAGAAVRAGQPLLVMEAMKMEHVVAAPASGTVVALAVAAGDAVREGAPLVFLAASDADALTAEGGADEDPDVPRADLAEAIERHAAGLDARRPDAVERRRRTGQRTARENIDDLCDPDSFAEYGALALAAQRSRRSLDDLIARTPADGLIGGIGTVNGTRVDPARSRCVVMTYDYTVLAGTQGFQNHRKKDRLFELAERLRLPVVLFAEGGGGRPGDVDAPGVSGLDCLAFQYFGQLSGLVPLVGIVSGRCFAGNAALLGCCDVVIATRGTNIGMGGPAMIEGGGLGVFRPEEVGPLDVQVTNGVVDVAVADEAEAVRVAKQYLSYFQGALGDWHCADQRRPAHRRAGEPPARVRRPRRRLRTRRQRLGARAAARLRAGHGHGAGAHRRPPARHHRQQSAPPRRRHRPRRRRQGGALHAALRRVRSADRLPLRHPGHHGGAGGRDHRAGAPRGTHVRRRRQHQRALLHGRAAQGLRPRRAGDGGRQLQSAALHRRVADRRVRRHGPRGRRPPRLPQRARRHRRRAERQALFEKMVARAYEIGKAVNVASHFEIDDVIDPADTRRWISTALAAAPPPTPRTGKKRPCVDPW
jgi:acetyl/propionyl-CoA carboxylase alpha subunit